MKYTIAKWGAAAALALTLWSCSAPKNITYLQDAANGSWQTIDMSATIRVQPGDKISIVTKSKDPQLSELFNLPVTSYRVGSTGGSSYSQQMSCYSVASDGTIDFPVVGKVSVAGMTREQVAKTLKEKLVSGNLVKDPVLTVEFENLHFSVLGEVSRPGQFNIDRDRVSLFDALSQAGDMTIYGRRDNVMVMRQQDGQQKIYRVNLNDSSEVFNSPVCFLQQNDIVVVEPNATRKRQSTVNGNNVLSASFWVSIASLLTSIGVLIFK
jgi:polysaccharide biosynthesis/export protein